MLPGPALSFWQCEYISKILSGTPALQLEYLPEEIERLQRLRCLYAQENRLKELPAGIGAMKSLEVLFAANNLLTAIPLGITYVLDETEKLDKFRHFCTTAGSFSSLAQKGHATL